MKVVAHAILKLASVAAGVLCAGATLASPVAVAWQAGEGMPAKVARPFAGFLKDGWFVVAGGTTHDGTTKQYVREIFLLPTAKGQSQTPDPAPEKTTDPDGIQKIKVGELPEGVGFAEGVSATVPQKGLFCAGGGVIHGHPG